MARSTKESHRRSERNGVKNERFHLIHILCQHGMNASDFPNSMSYEQVLEIYNKTMTAPDPIALLRSIQEITPRSFR